MTATAAELPVALLAELRRHILALPGISGLTYDLTQQAARHHRMEVAGPTPPARPWATATIFAFYWPLVLTSQMMTLAHPIINLGLGRSADAIVQLAAYGVGFGLGVFLNSPLFRSSRSSPPWAPDPGRRDLIIKGLSLGIGICALELLRPWGPWATGCSATSWARRRRWPTWPGRSCWCCAIPPLPAAFAGLGHRAAAPQHPDHQPGHGPAPGHAGPRGAGAGRRAAGRRRWSAARP